MSGNGANPFLFEEPSTFTEQTASNPFLMEEDYLYGNNYQIENPFLSQTAATVISTNSTNPFAFDPMDLGPAEAETATDCGTLTDTFLDQTLVSQAQPAVTISPQKPTELNLIYTNTIATSSDNSLEDASQTEGQKPLRPTTSTSKETKDLLMSVMGAMDATSSHLLDRIPPTRTPSPVSMKDLHSQCPTPELTNVEDLLDMGDSKMQETQTQQFQNTSIFQSDDLFSMNEPQLQNQGLVDNTFQNGTQNKPKPPRPEPPKRPAAPPKPPPPSKSPIPNVLKENNKISPSKGGSNEMIDMFGDENINVQPAVVQKTFASKEDILNLYNKTATVITQPIEEPKIDLLSDSMEMDTKPDLIQDHSVSEKNAFVNTELKDSDNNIQIILKDDSSSQISSSEPEQLVVSVENNLAVSEDYNKEHEQDISQESFTSPEKSVDLHMDVSETHSRGSISSNTINPFMATEESPPKLQQKPDILAENTYLPSIISNAAQMNASTFPQETKAEDEFDAFTAKFEAFNKDENKNGVGDAFVGNSSAWGSSNAFGGGDSFGGGCFENEEPFDNFLTVQEPPQVPQSTPNRMSKAPSQDSDEEKDFSVFIKPKVDGDSTFGTGVMPSIAPPPVHTQAAFSESSPRFNPFDQSTISNEIITQEPTLVFEETKVQRTDSTESPSTPLFDEDVSQPLEPFPRTTLKREEWEMHLRQPNKKKITGQRFWKKIFVMLVHQADCILLQLYNQKGDKDPFQELPLQPCYSVSDISAQQYDQYGKIFTLKLQYIFYKERPGVRPGQVKKAERITNKLSQFASYAIQGDYQGVKEFGSDLKKLGLPVEHAPQVSQLMKLGSLNYEDLKQFSVCIEEALFRISAHRDRALHYKMEEVQITAVDELYVDQEADGHVEKQIARVRLFFLGFLTGMPDVELGVNDLRRQGKEVVGRHDIIPVATEEWIRIENVEFHSCIQQDEYEKSHIIKFKPPDACYIEIVRFRVRPPRNRELPIQLKTSINVTGNKVIINSDILVPGFTSRKLGQIPCEDVMIRIPIPECWIYMFRVEKHFRYGSVKSAHRRTGKIKGIERILGTVDTLQESLIEVTSGQAKYEHQHRALVWRCPRLPKEGQGAYTTHNMICRLALTGFDQMPEKLPDYCYVEFTMPATQVSHTTVRSVSLQNTESDEPPEKYVRYLARHEYKVGIEHTEGQSQAAYEVVTKPKPTPTIKEEPTPATRQDSDSDDSD